MTTTTDVVPLSATRVSQVRPNYSLVDERHMQQYRQSKYQPWSPEPSRAPLVSNTNIEDSESGSCKKHLTSKLVMSIFIGLVICGIPLAVMSSLYAQKKASSNNNSTGSSGSSSNLPSQCTTYVEMADSTRLTTFTACTNCMYDTSGYFTAGWYRFVDPAGYRLAITPPSSGSCGASYPAWYNGTYPSTSGSTIATAVCVNFNGNLCYATYSTSISITNCNGFYVFYLAPISYSNVRYCTSY